MPSVCVCVYMYISREEGGGTGVGSREVESGKGMGEQRKHTLGKKEVTKISSDIFYDRLRCRVCLPLCVAAMANR